MMDKAISNPMEQFLLLSKSAKGAASADLVKQAVEAPGLYVFGELLDLENIKEVYFETLFPIFINFEILKKIF